MNIRILALALFVSLPARAADTVVWAGLDFSKAKLIGNDKDFKDTGKIFPGYLEKWNEMAVSEMKRHLEKATRAKIEVDLSGVEGVNRGAGASQIVPDGDTQAGLGASDLTAAVRSYSLKMTGGTALVFVIDRFVKSAERGCMHAVYFDIASRNVQGSEYLCGQARGMGFRNYWFGSVKNVIQDQLSKVQRTGGVAVATGGGSSGTTTAAPAPKPAAPAGGGMETYRGPRRQLKTPGIKCAAIPLKSSGAMKVGSIIDELLLTELQTAGFEAIGPDDVNALLGLEKMKDAAECSDAACIAQIGNALGVDFLIAGSVAKLEESAVLTLKLIDVKNTKVVARVSRIADNGEKGVPRVIGEAVQELVERSAM